MRRIPVIAARSPGVTSDGAGALAAVVLVLPPRRRRGETGAPVGIELATFAARLRPRFRTVLVLDAAGAVGVDGLEGLADIVTALPAPRSSAHRRGAIADVVEALGVPPGRTLWLDPRPAWGRAARAAGLATAVFGPAADPLGPARAALAMRTTTYEAAGGVVLDGDAVVVLRRPDRDEIRLPKGHIEPGESAVAAAVREVAEETGLVDTVVEADLGRRWVEFDTFPSKGAGWHVGRGEHYFRMRLAGPGRRVRPREARKFVPDRLPIAVALGALTQPVEREWLRLALDRSPRAPGRVSRSASSPAGRR